MHAKRLTTAIIATLIATAHAQTAPPITGDWAGALSVGGTQLHLIVHITATPDAVLHATPGAAALHATLDSVDQGANGIPVSSVTLKDGTLTLDVAAAHATYTGTLNPTATEIKGTWTQGQSLPLDLHKSATALKAETPRRPQNPTPPYPYQSIDLTYTNPLQHDTLAATLTVPPGKGPFPAVLLITGSGPQDRDESLMGHKPFLVLSDYLTRHGIAVLRADDRGTAKSTGDFASATTADFATDAEAGLALLKTRPEIDPHRIGLIGHSEGGLIAPMLAAGMVPTDPAARSKDVAFIVMVAGPGTPGVDIITAQTRLLDEASGMPKDAAEKAAAQERTILDLVVTEKDPAALDKKLHDALAGELPEAQIAPAIKQLTSPWFRYFLTYDPAPALRQVKCPVLALDGSKDLQVQPEQNLAAIRADLTAGGNTHFETVEFPNLNHLFQTATTGSPNEYATIEETFAPIALEKITTWINQQPPTP
jgi:pimeloyl-ACP methyl ester carboxylesterase